jgi:hypothetical protein
MLIFVMLDAGFVRPEGRGKFAQCCLVTLVLVRGRNDDTGESSSGGFVARGSTSKLGRDAANCRRYVQRLGRRTKKGRNVVKMCGDVVVVEEIISRLCCQQGACGETRSSRAPASTVLAEVARAARPLGASRPGACRS